jgi:hypothetical protein
LRDGSIRGEEARHGNTLDGHLCPFSVVFVGLVNFFIGLNVWIEIEAGDVVISAFSQVVQNVVAHLGITEEARFDCVKDSLESSTKVSLLTLIELLSNLGNALDQLTENEHVVSTDLF